MKRFKLVLLFLVCTSLVFAAGCKKTPMEEEPSEPTTEPDITAVPSPPELKEIEITKNGITCTIDSASGLVKKIASNEVSLEMDGVLVDIGIDQEYLFRQLGFTSFETAETWTLPTIWSKNKTLPDYSVDEITETERGFIITLSYDSVKVTYCYEIVYNAVKVTATFTTSSEEAKWVNGVAFLIKGNKTFSRENATFEFPGSTPGGIFPCADFSNYNVMATQYASPLVQFKNETQFQNFIFLNEQEKWTTGVFNDVNGLTNTVFLSATECNLSAGDELTVGSLYIPLTPYEEDSYLSVQDFWADLGYRTPDQSVNDGPVYSCHPYGTMDTNYFNKWTLSEYAEQLNSLASIGFKNIWLLPVFYHTGNNVYEPIDQGVIDKRYGGEEEAKLFIQKAHDLNLRVLFDLVPHGPRPVYEFAKEHDDWISKDRTGKNQIEWECVSFDYNNPGYYSYNVELMERYARDFSLDGARIDCAMGGLSNWSPVDGLRPSSSGLKAGVTITKAIKEGFVKGGVTPMLLPENFHPVPYYAEYTDLFYDMPLFRMINSLNNSDISETEYVKQLSHWLDAEQKTSVKGQIKLRFIDNHDTVTWTFDAQRPQKYYGAEKAKALWSIMSFIDGVPMIYQGDEDPKTYQLEGANLEQFFTELFAARSAFLPQTYETTYLDTNTPIFALIRHNQDSTDAKLILVNLSAKESSWTLEQPFTSILYQDGECTVTNKQVTMSPYSAMLLQLE